MSSNFWDEEKGAIKQEFWDHHKQLATFHATEESRRLTIPQSPDAYEIKLPEDFQPPAGFENYKPDANNPLMAQARQLMHDIDSGKVSGQTAFSKLLALNAAREIGTAQMLKTARDAEIAKLGANGSARVTAVENFIAAQAGEELFNSTKSLLATSAMVQVWEKIMRAFHGQGAGTFAPSRSPDVQRVDDKAWDKMTYSQKKEYASQFTNGRAN